MSFNSKLNFEPEIEHFKRLDKRTHILLSGYLRHSLTFELYHRIANSLSLNLQLLPFELAIQDSEPKLDALFEEFRSNSQFQSMMVSDPYKQALFDSLDELTENATKCNAVNMIFKKDGKLVGDNLDGLAFLYGLEFESKIDFSSKSICFFGCGGVSTAIAVSVIAATENNLGLIGLCDVKTDKVENLSEILKSSNPELEIEILQTQAKRDLRKYAILYNGTGLGKTGSDQAKTNASPLHPEDQLNRSGIALDANYSPEVTKFLKQCSDGGLSTRNGLSHMLASTSLHLSRVTGQAVTMEVVRQNYQELISSRS